MKVTLISCGPAVNESERRAFEQIKTGLISELGDGEWLLLTNLAFSTTHRRQSDEIDIVAIGPPGVRVIEVKHWNAAWVNQNAELVEREAERVTDKARKIGTTLRRKVSRVSAGWMGCSWSRRMPRKSSRLRGGTFGEFGSTR